MDEKNYTSIEELIRRHQQDRGSEGTADFARLVARYYHALIACGVSEEAAMFITSDYQRAFIEWTLERGSDG